MFKEVKEEKDNKHTIHHYIWQKRDKNDNPLGRIDNF